MTTKYRDKVRRTLMHGRTWRYLRYIHLREAFLAVGDQIESVGVVGAGHGYSEIALAIEFPHIHFTLTDIIAPGYPNYHKAMDICWKWGINNVAFSVWNVLEPSNRRFDMVCSTEVLEHIEDAKSAAAKMREAAEKFVYCLVPFADKETNANENKRKRALEAHGHFVYGYDAEDLESLFPDPVFLKGAYFEEAGQVLRHQLKDLSPEEIDAQLADLKALAEADIQDRIPETPAEGQGIKILSRTTA